MFAFRIDRLAAEAKSEEVVDGSAINNDSKTFQGVKRNDNANIATDSTETKSPPKLKRKAESGEGKKIKDAKASPR